MTWGVLPGQISASRLNSPLLLVTVTVAMQHSDPPVSNNNMFLSPTCQVRVVRFYVSPPSSSILRRTSIASSRSPVPRRTPSATSESKCSPPDLHRKLRIRVFPAGPPPQAQDQSVPRRTSTASSGSECSPPRRTSTTKNLRRYTR